MTRSFMPPSQSPREIQVSSITFLREQTGEPEGALKNHLIKAFKHRNDVQRAYLAQVRTGDQLGVALCLRNLHGPDQHLVEEIGAIFATVFSSRVHLDILFLDDAHESKLANVCAPFFVKSSETVHSPKEPA